MWFAAFSRQAEDLWFFRLADKLLAGDRTVARLLRTNPFPDVPPRALRARYYRYRFTTPAERRATGNWWHRALVGEYLPAVTADHPTLRLVRHMLEPAP